MIVLCQKKYYTNCNPISQHIVKKVMRFIRYVRKVPSNIYIYIYISSCLYIVMGLMAVCITKPTSTMSISYAPPPKKNPKRRIDNIP